MNDPEIAYTWHRLTDLPEDWKALVVPQLGVVAQLWSGRLGELRGSPGLTAFNERLARKWAIETGIVEGVYRIDRGITELLIERGIEAALIPHGATDRPAEDIVQILKDHQESLEGLFTFVSSQRPLSISYIKELHTQLCRSQEFVVGRDPFGNRVQRPLQKGEWKQWPNSPLRQDGRLHEYCPPVHVASEMEKLVSLHLEHMEKGIAPEVEAAWLHHRFTQIHPFEDGNGRVARALATLVLLRAELFPFVVDRDQQGEYIDALEKADHGDLGLLVKMIARQQQEALLAALDLSRDVIRDLEVTEDLEAAVKDAARKVQQREYERQRRDFQNLVEVASDLIKMAKHRMEEVGCQLEAQLSEPSGNNRFEAQTSFENQSHWFRYEIIQAARKHGYYANPGAWHRWVRLRLRAEPEAQIVISFHQSGRDFRGILMASAFFEFREREEPADGFSSVALGNDAFAISLKEDADEMKSRFRIWLDMILSAGIREWSKGI
jgi:Fic family protein